MARPKQVHIGTLETFVLIGNGLSGSEIAKHLGINQPSFSKRKVRLETYGWITREGHEYTLTNLGRKMLPVAREFIRFHQILLGQEKVHACLASKVAINCDADIPASSLSSLATWAQSNQREIVPIDSEVLENQYALELFDVVVGARGPRHWSTFSAKTKQGIWLMSKDEKRANSGIVGPRKGSAIEYSILHAESKLRLDFAQRLPLDLSEMFSGDLPFLTVSQKKPAKAGYESSRVCDFLIPITVRPDSKQKDEIVALAKLLRLSLT